MDRPERKKLRLDGWNYSSKGWYFVTICAKERKRLFGAVIVGAIHESPQISLSPLGQIVKEVIVSIQKNPRLPDIEKYVIMPNHIHMIVRICPRKAGAIRESPLRKKRSEYSKLVGYLKAEISKRAHRQFLPERDIWQRGSYDHIIRNEQDYQRIWNYIDTNPTNWQTDCYF